MTRLTILLLILSFSSCQDKAERLPDSSENEMDAARNFIRAALDGNYDQAKNYMLLDSLNVERLESIQRNYQANMKREDKRGYREASIQLYDSRQLNDSTIIVSYSNSYMNKKDSLKLLKMEDEWLVDLKYSFLPADSTKQ